jgi:Predicted hydrolase of the HD superfamily (permuted catalytic motifs)
MISPGERLCPWCLVKRALGAEPRLMRTLLLGDLCSVEKIVNEIVSKDVKIEIPSTNDRFTKYEKIGYNTLMNLCKLVFRKILS